MWQQIVAWLNANRRPLLALVVALAGGGGLTVAVVDNGGSPVVSKTVTLAGPGRSTVTLDAGGQKALKQALKTDAGDHDNLRSEAPPGVPQEQLDAARAQDERLAAADQLPLVAPLASPEQRGCVTRQVGNFSTRGGVRPRLFVLHFTVSANRPGWDDVNAIVAFFNSASSQASSNYVVDNEGHCALIVQEAEKAWTQATFNPVSISVEVINTGSEPTYAGTAGLAKLAQIVSDATKRWNIPLQRGGVSGCTVTRPGIVDHQQLGLCGGGHSDIGSYSVQAVIDAAAAYRRESDHSSPLTSSERQMVARRCHHDGLASSARTSAARRRQEHFVGVWRHVIRAQMNRIRAVARQSAHGWDHRSRGERYQLLGRALRGASC